MKKLFLISLLGYPISVFSAVTVTVLIFFAPTVFPDDGRFGSFVRLFNEGLGIFFVGLVYTFVTALPGYCITLYIAHRLNWHSWQYYCFAGMMTAILAHFILGTFMRGANLQPFLVFACSIPGGAIGALSYFHWRRKILSALSG